MMTTSPQIRMKIFSWIPGFWNIIPQIFYHPKLTNFHSWVSTFSYFQNLRQNIQGIYHFDEYFQKIDVIAKNKDFPARVRFLLQDVIDSRKNNWKPRREKAGPKTIDQIHKEAESEKLNQQVLKK